MNCELLAPAGGEQSAYAALLAGADAVYLGLTKFSAREGAENFGIDALCRVVRFAHILGAKVYVALNTLVKDGETEEFFRSVSAAWQTGADAILMQDLFLGKALKERYPALVLHLSTQAGCCNADGARLAAECGFSRVVLARETPLGEIEAISRILETEAFVQGALCSCFSGQCYLSSFAGNHSGNRGRCKQPCRKRYRIDRAGYENEAYALSLSDLCVGEDVHRLLDAGVTSLKIEGRMRREEYVSAAVRYYRALLAGSEGKAEFTRLRRAFNRGDYTRGLAFGQGGDLLSRKVQGHIGEDVGAVTLQGGRFFCKSDYAAKKGDGFKILRRGSEIGGAAFERSGAGGFYLASSARLQTGDRVRLTTEHAPAEAGEPALRRVRIRVRLAAGELPFAESEKFCMTGSKPVQAAQRAPLSCGDVEACFARTDGLPVLPEVEAETVNAFLPRAELNAFRRAFFEGLADHLAPARAPFSVSLPEPSFRPVRGTRRAAIVPSFAGMRADVLILKPADYARVREQDVSEGEGEKYLYLPPFFTAEDEALVSPLLPLFDGIYCEGTYGIFLAQRYHKKLFAGTGFNLTNRFAVQGVLAAGAAYFALSKECSSPEQRALAAEGAFALTGGAIKVMDLCYCPFERTCAACDRREVYRLTDEAGREFPLRRYRLSGEGCRFEVYNCAPLAAYNGETSALVDLSAGADGAFLREAFTPERVQTAATRGHSERSVR